MAEESAAATSTSTNHKVDLGHLMAYDPSHHLAAVPSCRAELREECLRKAMELAQAVVDALFALPATEGHDGPVVHLPPPTNRLPREKHVSITYPFCYHLRSPTNMLYRKNVAFIGMSTPMVLGMLQKKRNF
jgi:regulator of ribosome biosynthesis